MDTEVPCIANKPTTNMLLTVATSHANIRNDDIKDLDAMALAPMENSGPYGKCSSWK